MKVTRKVSRRSFMASVGATAGGGALALVNGRAEAQVTDGDPTDPVGRGRGTASPQPGGITDSDTGAGADPAGHGRGPRSPSGVTDSDTGSGADPVGQGRGPRSAAPGLTDSDSGSGADPVGHGRGPGASPTSGITDSDPTDPVRNGRGTSSSQGTGARLSGVTDSDTGSSADPAGNGRGKAASPGTGVETGALEPAPPLVHKKRYR
jgi:hypothetical protein